MRLCGNQSKQTVKKEIDCDDVKAEDTYTLGNENYSNISNTQPKSEVEEHEPQMASQTKPAALVQTVQIPFAATADDTKNGLSGLQEVYQPTANGAIGTLGILPQAIPPLLPTPIFPYDNGACNLYFRKNKRPRPLSLCKDTIMKRNRKPVVDRQTSS
ncbi:unnamed protein product [Haemonchus placei]|uniref:Uncharacterized protein n=1 Tax=Haemonchus placei TaxID=6290 RepID=A0A0N4WLQ4_HAEPC|nr:unnamed protein product [Haemonchus placei]